MVDNNLTAKQIKQETNSDQLVAALTHPDIEIVSAALINHNTTNETIYKAIEHKDFNPNNLEIIVNNVDYRTVTFVQQIVQSLIGFFNYFYIRGVEDESFDGEKVYNVLAAIQALLIKAPLANNQMEQLFNVVKKIENSGIANVTMWGFNVSCDEIRKLILFHPHAPEALKYEIWDEDPAYVASILSMDEVRGGKLIQRHWFTQADDGTPLHVTKWYNMPTRIKISLSAMTGILPVIGLEEWINRNSSSWKQEIINYLNNEGYDVNEDMPMGWLQSVIESVEN